MNNEQLLEVLASKLATGELRPEEVTARLHVPTPQSSAGSDVVPATGKKPFSISKMLYIFGAVVVVIGIVIFVGQIWGDLATVGRIMITLGVGFLFAILGSVLLYTDNTRTVGSVFHAIGGILVPGGVLVTLYEINPYTLNEWSLTFSFLGVFLFYVLLMYVHKNPILTFFAIVNGTITLYSMVYAMIGYYDLSSYFFDIIKDVYVYLTIAIGGSYLLMAYAFRDGWNQKLSSVLYFFGTIGVLGASFMEMIDSLPWQMLYLLLIVGAFMLSVYVKSRNVLTVTTLFLIAYVSYITGEYFADSVGWPISLVILGFVFIGLGYMSININKKYISQ